MFPQYLNRSDFYDIYVSRMHKYPFNQFLIQTIFQLIRKLKENKFISDEQKIKKPDMYKQNTLSCLIINKISYRNILFYLN